MFSLRLLLLAAASALAMPIDGTDGAVEVESVQKATGIPKVPVTKDVFDDLVYYSAFAATAVKPCAVLPDGIKQVKYINNTATDTQAALFQVDARKLLVLGIPGTESDTDAITDFRFFPKPYNSTGNTCSGCMVHTGFQGAWNSIQDEVTAAIKAALAANPTYTVAISGHSLGGAIAHLAFGSLKPQSLRIAKLLTYGSPRVGNPAFANYIDALAGASDTQIGTAYRVTHFNDPVPRVPPAKFFSIEFKHPRTEFWESTMNVTQAETFRCFGQEPDDCLFSISPALNGDAHVSYAGIQSFCKST